MNRALTILATSAVALTIAGCAGAPRSHQRGEFPVAEYESYKSTGSATVAGGVSFAPRMGMETVKKMTYQAFMLPATTYSQFAYDQSYRWNYNVTSPDPRQEAFVKRAGKSSSGDFRFENVQAGEWYVFTRIDWYQAGRDYTRFRGKKVTVRQGESIKVDLTLPPASQEGQNETFQ